MLWGRIEVTRAIRSVCLCVRSISACIKPSIRERARTTSEHPDPRPCPHHLRLSKNPRHVYRGWNRTPIARLQLAFISPSANVHNELDVERLEERYSYFVGSTNRALMVMLCVVFATACEAPQAPESDLVTLPEPPRFRCPPGWAEREGVCDPFPGGGVPTCSGSSMPVIPGGCRPIGTECPADGLPENLPDAASTVYVLASAPEGGTGGRRDPVRTIAEALRLAGEDAIVAVGVGTYRETMSLSRPTTIWGACPAQTTISATHHVDAQAIVEIWSSGVTIRNLRFSGERAAILVQEGGALIEDVLIEDAVALGIGATRGSMVEVRRVAVRDMRQNYEGNFGYGVHATHGANVVLEDLSIERCHGYGLAIEVGATVDATRVFVADTAISAAEMLGGHAVVITSGAAATLRELVLIHNVGAEILMTGELTTLDIQDVVATDLGLYPEEFSWAIQAGYGRITGRRILVDRCENGVSLVGGVDAVLEDVAVRRVAGIDEPMRVALGVSENSTARLSRVALDDNQGMAMLVRRAATVDIEDLSVTSTSTFAVSGALGRGIEVNRGGVLRGRRVLLRDNHDYGLVVAMADSVATLSDVWIEGTLSTRCDLVRSCGGVGAVASEYGTLSIERFVLLRNSQCGAQVLWAGLQLRDGEIRENPVGLCMAGSESDEVSTDVTFRQNQRNLARDDRPPPAPFMLPD